jgi:hypothetical protein
MRLSGRLRRARSIFALSPLVRANALFASGRATRDGIPIVFPWFGPDRHSPTAPQHGFARTATWHLDGVETAGAEALTLTLSLGDGDVGSQFWPEPFREIMADIQKDAVEQAAHALSGTNKRVTPVQVDVTLERPVVDALAEAERAFDKLHVACDNSGVPIHGTRLTDVSPGEWEFVMRVNVGGSSTASVISSRPSFATES